MGMVPPNSSGDLVLTTLVIGPEAEGRGYQLLAPDRLKLAGARDLAMVLMEWSRSGEKDFAGCLALNGSQEHVVVFRARHVSRRALGEAAYLNGVIVPREQLATLGYRTELLLGHIPLPDGSTRFADKQVTLAAPSEAEPPAIWDGLGLAWRDCEIVTPAVEEREDILLRALASIDPPEQRSRVAQWVTSNHLVSRGALDPLGQAQLVIGDARGPETASNRARWTEAGGLPANPPESWAAWLGVMALLAESAGSATIQATMRWRPEYAGLRAEETVIEALRIATGALAPDEMTALLERSLASGFPFDTAAISVATDYVEALRAGGVAGSTVERLWSETGRSAALTSALLRISDNTAQLDLEAKLAAASQAVREGALSEDEMARQGLVNLMNAAIVSADTDIKCFAEIVDNWPASSKQELFALTSSGGFEKIHQKSRISAERLAFKIFRRDCYAFGVRGEGSSVTVRQRSGLQEALRAIAIMRAG